MGQSFVLLRSLQPQERRVTRHAHAWRRLCAALCASVALLNAHPLRAQDQRGYAGGAVLVRQLSPRTVGNGTPSTTYVNTSDGKTVTGLVGEVGAALRPRLALGVEFGLPARHTITQSYSYFDPYVRESRYRELTIFGVVRTPLAEGTRTKLSLVGGGGMVRTSALERVATGRFGAVSFGAFGPETAVTRWSLGATGGGELDVQMASRLTVVAQARVLVIPHGDPLDSGNAFGNLGLHAMSAHFQFGLRATF